MIGKYTYLQVALFVFGAIFCLVYPLALVWPAGWMWHEGAPLSNNYYAMILGVYATLGIFLIRAASNRRRMSRSSGSPSGRASSTRW